MRIVFAVAVALAIVIAGALWRHAAASVSKTYGLSVVSKNGICEAHQEASANGVSPFSVLGELGEATAKVAAHTKEESYNCLGAAIPVEKKDYVGDWSGSGHALSIASSGKVHYQAHEVRNEGGTDVTHTDTLDLPFQKFEGDAFLIGAMYWSMTFRVTEPPHQEGATWRMTLNGVTYSRS
jgi:hypothetical protein